MEKTVPFIREDGIGPVVVCVHPSTSSSGQWKPLGSAISSRFKVIAPDIYGHGRSIPWNESRDMTLDDEAEFIENALKGFESFHLVGHSYGGAIAIKLAQRNRARIRSIALFEPGIWGTISSTDPYSPGAREIREIRDQTLQLIAHGNIDAAARAFIDFWSGCGSYESIPEGRRSALYPAIRALIPGWSAIFSEVLCNADLELGSAPWLLMRGADTRECGKLVVERLRQAVAHAEVMQFPGLGHLGPITHPAVVNPVIDSFISKVESTI